MPDFEEIADRVWVARFAWFDVNVGLVAGEHGLVVVDTNASGPLGEATLAAIRRVSSAPVVAAVNTHVHVDHVLGNGAFAAVGADLIAHEAAAAAFDEHLASVTAASATEVDPRFAELIATEPVPPTRTFSSALAVDLGDRVLELIHPGRGHTDGDVVVRVPDADVLFAGDLVEESVHSTSPGLGPDCFPMEWPATLDLVISLAGASAQVVPGHGRPVDRDFVDSQRAALGVVAETIRDLAGRGVALDAALAAADWPYPREDLVDAVRRGYEHLPAVRRQLPLI